MFSNRASAPNCDSVRTVEPPAAKVSGLLFLQGVTISLLFWWVFKNQISPTFAYGGMVYREPNLLFLIVSICMAGAVAVLAPSRVSQAGEFVLVALTYMVAIPAIIMPNIIAIADIASSFLLSTVAAAIFAGLNIFYFQLSRLGNASTNPTKFVSRVRPDIVLIVSLLAFTAVTYLLLYQATGLTLVPQTFEDLYNAREESSLLISMGSPILTYALPTQIKAINPALVSIGLYDKRYLWLAIVGILGQYLGYTVANQKQALFSILVVAGLALLLRSRRSLSHSAISAAIISLSAVASLVDQWRGKIYWSEVVVDRFFLIPGLLPTQYYVTFTDVPFNLWSDAFMGLLIQDRLPGTVPSLLVGLDLTGNDGVNANTSFLGNGYANLGFIGVIVEALLLLVIVLLLTQFARKLPARLSIPLSVMPAVSLANGSPFTAILSGGVLAVILVMWWLSRSAKERSDDVKTQRPNS